MSSSNSCFDKVKGLRPQFIHPEPTNICNSDCVFCPQPSLQRDRGTMTFDLYCSVIAQAVDAGCQKMLLYWMADPFGDPLIFEKIEYAKQKGVSFILTSTNAGQLTNDKSERLLAAGLDELNISLEGTDSKTYEKIRCGLNYKKIVENIKTFLHLKRKSGQKKPYVTMRTVYMDSTYDMVESYIRKWREDSDQITIGSVANWAGDSDYDNRRSLEKKKIKRDPCPRLWKDICITWDGIASPCFFDSDVHYPLGSIYKKSLVELFNHDLMVELRQRHKNGDLEHPLCSKCDENVHSDNIDIKKIIL